MTNQTEQIQAATDRIADQVRRLLTRETTFAELCEFIREELRNAHETNQQEKKTPDQAFFGDKQ